MIVKIAGGWRDNEIISFWVAEITGKDPKWKYARKFVSWKEVCDTSSRHKYYDLFAELQEGKIYQIKLENRWNYGKNKYGFFIFQNGEMKKISREEVEKKIQE